MSSQSDVLAGPKFPLWGCSRCGQDGNWASRIRCRGCGNGASQKVVTAAKAAAARAKQEKPQGGGGAQRRQPSASDGGQSKAIRELQSEIAALKKSNGGGAPRGQQGQQHQSGGDGLTYAQVLMFLKSADVGDGAIQAVEAAKQREFEAKPPSAIAAQHRVENAKRKVERLDEKLKQLSEQKAELDKSIVEVEAGLVEARSELDRHVKMAHRVHLESAEDPVEVGLAGLDPTVVSSAEGKAALETLQQLQRKAREARESAQQAPQPGSGSDGPGVAPPPGGPGGVPAPGGQGQQHADRGFAPMAEEDLNDEELQQGIKRLVEAGGDPSAIGKLMADHAIKKQRRL